MNLFLALLFAAVSAYPGAPPPSHRDWRWSSHYASTDRDPALPTLPVWPLPQQGSFPSGAPRAACLTPFFSISCDAASLCPDILSSGFDRYAGYLFFAGAPAPLAGGAPAVTALTVRVLASAPLALRVSENYTLTVPNGLGNDTVAVLTADTQWGALRGLETFSQLFIWSGRGVPVSYCTANAGLQVADWPRYPWRGLLLDSARHFLPLPAIFVTLEAMAFNKLNTLHWHIVDDQSWPLFVLSSSPDPTPPTQHHPSHPDSKPSHPIPKQVQPAIPQFHRWRLLRRLHLYARRHYPRGGLCGGTRDPRDPRVRHARSRGDLGEGLPAAGNHVRRRPLPS